MESEDILIELKELSSQYSIKKSELMIILKKYAHTISVYDLMGFQSVCEKKENFSMKSIVNTSLKFILKISYCA